MGSRKGLRGSKDKAINFDTSTSLTVLVGKEPNQKRFSVHEGFLCPRSEFFRRAMNGNWVEREERLIKLPDDDPEIFAIYVNLVYTSVLATSRRDTLESREAVAEEYLTLSKLYVLSEKFCDTPAKNAALEAMLDALEEQNSAGTGYLPGSTIVNIIYAGTPSKSPARRLLADMFTIVNVDSLESCGAILTKDFFVDYALALRKDRPDNRKSVAERNDRSVYMETQE